MTASMGFMLSFIEQQDKAEQVTAVLSKVMNYIKPFQKYLSPFGAVGVLGKALGEEIPAIGDTFDRLKNAAGKGIGTVLNLILDKENSLFSALGLTDVTIDTSGFPDISLNAIKNFVNNCDILKDNSMMDMVLIAVEDLLDSYGLSSEMSLNSNTGEGYGMLATWMRLLFCIGPMLNAVSKALSGMGGYGGLLMETISFILVELSLVMEKAMNWFTLLALGITNFGFAWTLSGGCDQVSLVGGVIEVILADGGFLLSIL